MGILGLLYYDHSTVLCKTSLTSPPSNSKSITSELGMNIKNIDIYFYYFFPFPIEDFLLFLERKKLEYILRKVKMKAILPTF